MVFFNRREAVPARKEQERAPSFLPLPWALQLRDLLQENYSPQKKIFKVFGLTYPNEVLLAISLVDEKGHAIPVTYLASCDLSSESQQSKIVDKLVDSAGFFFDAYFESGESFEYIPSWEQAERDGVTFFIGSLGKI